MQKVAVIGDKESVYGFSSIGVETFPVFSGEKAGEIIDMLAEKNYGIIYVTEAVAAKIPHIIEKYSEYPTPAILLIPGVRGNTGEGAKNICKLKEKAIGVKLN